MSGRVLDGVARTLGLRHAGELDEAARAGSWAARGALEEAASVLAAGLRSVTAAADPRVIVLGGGLAASGRLLPRLVAERWPAVRPAWSAAGLRLSRLGADAGLYGAALLAVQLIAQPAGPPAG